MPAGTRARRLHPLTIVVTAVSLLVVAALSFTAYEVEAHSEDRLLKLKVGETGALLQAAISSIQTPLASAAEFAAAVDQPQRVDAFRGYVATYVGTGKPFGSASLWQLSGTQPHLLTVVGDAPKLASDTARASTFLRHAPTNGGVSVLGLLTGPAPRLGYAYAVSGPHPDYVVYAESVLPPNRRIPVTKGTPFSDLRFSLYLGSKPDPANLLETNIGGSQPHTASVVVPFGDTTLLVVAAAAQPLGSSLAAALWWIVAASGAVLALTAGAMTERLVRRRSAAERLAEDVQRLLAEQRAISETLQHAMVPPAPPAVAGLEIGVRYVPGTADLQIGGDWYDVVDLGGGRTFLTIGDVSGHGVGAGAMMASIRSAVRAFASEGHGPATVLDKVSQLVAESRTGQFATMVCGIFDCGASTLTLAGAGHLPPLLVRPGASRYLSPPKGAPVGALTDALPYRETTVSLPRPATLLLFTDGLVERRGESIDAGLARLREVADEAPTDVDRFLDTVTAALEDGLSNDDTALLALRWGGRHLD